MTSVLPANFARVSPVVWRGARPDIGTPEQVRYLYDNGVRTFLNLEWEQGDEDFLAAYASRIRVCRVKDFEPLPFFAPSVADVHVITALGLIRFATRLNPPPSPAPIVYVHCRSGQNRTGVVIAAYRLILLNDALDSVLAEFTSYRGFWAWADERYIRSVAARRTELRAKIMEGYA